MPYVWIKWRHKFASGPGEWNWTEVQNPSDFEEVHIPEYTQDFLGEDLYRGIEWEKADPPDEVLKDKLLAVESTLRFLREKRGRIRKILDYRKYPGTWFEKDRSANWFTLEDGEGTQITVMRYSGRCSVTRSNSSVIVGNFVVLEETDESMALAAIAKWEELSNA